MGEGTRPADAGAESVVIIGAGHAGATAAMSLRDRGWSGRIVLVGDEDGAPYQRPPLSKDCLLTAADLLDFPLQPIRALERDGIEYIAGARATRVDRARRVVALHDGREIGFGRLVLATGSRALRLGLPGEGLDGVHVLRTIRDAAGLRTGLRAARNVVVVGGGFLGLEVATAAAATARVLVLARLPHILRRSVSPPVAQALVDSHEQRGVRIRTDVRAVAIEGAAGRVAAVRLDSGERVEADLVLVAIGAAPNTELAAGAGLRVTDGILVDERLRTDDPAIHAIGDCARYESDYAGGSVRVESVQNATDQARFVAGELLGEQDGPFRSVPWFWSHQAGRNLQIAGLARPEDEVRAIETGDDGLVVHRFRAGALVAVETIDAPRAHIRARKALTDGPVLEAAPA